MRERNPERGHLMVGLMVGVAIMVILSTVAVQAWEDVLRRDNEAEMMFRAQEIARAIRKYQKDKGAYPTELKLLMEPGNRGQYFLRHLYKDPLVKGGKWGLLFLAPGGGVYDPHGEEGEGTDAAGNPVVAPARPGGLFSGPGASGEGLGGKLGSRGAGAAPARTGLDPQNQKSGQLGGFAGAGGGEEQGLPIVGVKSLCTDEPFRVYMEQTEYSKWLFHVFQQEVLSAIPGLPNQGRPPGMGTTPPGMTPPGTVPPGTMQPGARPPGTVRPGLAQPGGPTKLGGVPPPPPPGQ